MRNARFLVAGVAALCLTAASAVAYPVRPITLIIGFAAGGPSDVMARVLTRKMEDLLKQPFIVENKPGAGGGLAGALVARAPADGYTIMLASGTILAINQHLYKNVPYNPEKDFEPISLVGSQTNVLYVHPSMPAKTLPEFIAHARANPGKLSFASGGSGTPAHLAGELLKVEAKLQMTHIPFKGTGPALQNVIAGHVPAAFNPPAPLIPHLQAGSIRAIAISSLKRTGALPDVPTIAELGYPGFEADTWHAMVAPAGTPKAVIDALHGALITTLKDPSVAKIFADQGVDIVGGTPTELRDYLRSEIPKWEKIVKASGATVD